MAYNYGSDPYFVDPYTIAGGVNYKDVLSAQEQRGLLGQLASKAPNFMDYLNQNAHMYTDPNTAAQDYFDQHVAPTMGSLNEVMNAADKFKRDYGLHVTPSQDSLNKYGSVSPQQLNNAQQVTSGARLPFLKNLAMDTGSALNQTVGELGAGIGETADLGVHNLVFPNMNQQFEGKGAYNAGKFMGMTLPFEKVGQALGSAAGGLGQFLNENQMIKAGLDFSTVEGLTTEGNGDNSIGGRVDRAVKAFPQGFFLHGLFEAGGNALNKVGQLFANNASPIGIPKLPEKYGLPFSKGNTGKGFQDGTPYSDLQPSDISRDYGVSPTFNQLNDKRVREFGVEGSYEENRWAERNGPWANRQMDIDRLTAQLDYYQRLSQFRPEEAAQAINDINNELSNIFRKGPPISEEQQHLMDMADLRQRVADAAWSNPYRLSKGTRPKGFQPEEFKEASPQLSKGTRPKGFPLSLSERRQAAITEATGKAVDGPPITGTAYDTVEDKKPLPNLQDFTDCMGNLITKGPLGRFANTLYHESGASRALDIISGQSFPFGLPEYYTSNSPELALGQGQQKGIKIELDPTNLNGTLNRSKPTWQFSYQNGDAELIVRDDPKKIRDAVKSVTITKDAKMSSTERIMLKSAMRDWESVTNADGSVTYTPRQELVKGRAQQAGTEPFTGGTSYNIAPDDEPATLDELAHSPSTGVYNDVPTSDKIKRAFGILKGKILKALDQGDPPIGLAGVAKTGEDPEKKFITTLKQSPNTEDGLKALLQGTYEVETNKDVLNMVNKDIAVDGVEKSITELYKANGDYSAYDIIKGQRVIQELQSAGDHKRAAEVADHIATQLTNAGKMIQAASVWNRLSPEGVLIAAQRILKENKGKTPSIFSKFPTEMSEQDLRDLRDLAVAGREAKTLNEQRYYGALVMQRLGELRPITIDARLRKLQLMAMLLNPKTFERNIIGNAVVGTIDSVAQVPSAIVDRIISLKTGEKTIPFPNFSGVKTLFSPQAWKQTLHEIELGIDTRGDLNSKFEIAPRRVFKGVPILGGAEKLLDYELRLPDRIAYQMAFDESLAGRLNLTGKNWEELGSEGQATLLAQARTDALYRTLQDETLLGKGVGAVIKGLNGNKQFGLGSLIAPFTSTPSSLFMKAYDFSPLGFLRGAGEVVNSAMGKGFSQETFAKSLGRAFTGTGTIVTTGMILGHYGLLSGDAPKSPNENSTWQQMGIKPNSANMDAILRFFGSGLDPDKAVCKAGDSWMDGSFMQPFWPLLYFGRGLVQEQSNTINLNPSPFLQANNALVQGINTNFEAPMLQGFQTIFGTQDEEGNPSIPAGVEKFVGGLGSQFIPSALGNVNQTTNPYMPNTKPENALGYFTNQTLSKIPFLSKALPQQYNSSGNPQLRFPGGKGVLGAWLDPFNSSKQVSDPVLQETMRLKNATNKRDQFLTKLPSTVDIGGTKYKLSNDELNQYQHALGTVSYKAYKDVMKSPYYQSLTDEDKVSALKYLKGEANKATKEFMFNLPENEQASELQQAFKDGYDTGDFNDVNMIMEEYMMNLEEKRLDKDN